MTSRLCVMYPNVNYVKNGSAKNSIRREKFPPPVMQNAPKKKKNVFRGANYRRRIIIRSHQILFTVHWNFMSRKRCSRISRRHLDDALRAVTRNGKYIVHSNDLDESKSPSLAIRRCHLFDKFFCNTIARHQVERHQK